MPDLKAITRSEKYKAAAVATASGEEADIPEPITRDDQWMVALIRAIAAGGGGGGGGGTTNYNLLTNRPQINGHLLSGNQSTADLGINIPTVLSAFTNDAGYVKVTQMEFYVGGQVNEVLDMTLNTKSISNLPVAESVANADLLPVYKGNSAYAAPATLFKGEKGDDGNGIQSIQETTVSTESGGVNIITVTMTDGTTATFSVKNGAKGDTGRAFQVVKTYASIAAMEADFSGTDTETGDFVMISSNVEDPDNAKLYVKGESAFTFVSDLSGQQGMKGDDGEDGTGIASITSGTDASGNTTLTISLTDGTTQSFTVSKGTDATINGVTTLTVDATDGVTATQSGSTLTLSAPGIAKILNGLMSVEWIREASGNPATITDAAAAPVRALSVEIVPQQAAGTPSPDNPLPITGWTTATVTRTGENGADPLSVSVSMGSAGTVFAGTLDVLSGTLTVTHKCASAQSLTWKYLSGYVYVNLPDSTTRKEAVLSNVLAYYDDYYTAVYPAAWWGGSPESNKNLCIGITDVTTSLATWNSFIQSQDVQIVYKLATPLTYTLTPAQLSTLAGTNVVYADCGPVIVTYKGDPAIIFGS